METMLENLSWTTEKRRIKDLVKFDKNPRKMSNKAKAELQRSIEKFNLAEIPAIDTDNIVLAGNQRLRTLLELGRGDEEIDVRVPNRALSQDERAEYLLRSNKNLGEWDEEMLVSDFGRDVMLEAGFTSAEIESMSSKDEEKEQEKEFEVPGMALKAFEHHDYIVLAFHRTEDWLRALDLFGVQRVNYSWVTDKKKLGMGRIVDGTRVFEMFDNKSGKADGDHDPKADPVGDSAGAGERKKPVRTRAKKASGDSA